MIWYSEHPTAKAFTQAVLQDADVVFVSSNGHRADFAVSSAADVDPNMCVLGPKRSWRVNIRKEGRRLRPFEIKLRANWK